jgi:tRNA nucleotidyltransferase
MDRVSRYFFTSFIASFANLFATLFVIMSVVFFIQIARITSFIEISGGELIKLYLFMLPRILIFTIPIAFFTALATSFYALSKENESIVIFTLGYNPAKIARFFLFFAGILSTSLLFISLVMMPITENLKDNFIDYKKTKAQLNIKSNKFGQKFFDWLIYIDATTQNGDDTIYQNIIMYQPKTKQNDERIISAKSAEFKSLNSYFELELKDGKSYTPPTSKINTWHITNFKSMLIRTKSRSDIRENGGVIKYWQQARTDKKRRKDLTIYALISLFPLCGTLFALSFGIVTYRYEKGILYFGVFGVLFAYFASIMLLAPYPQIAITTVFASFFVASIIYFKFKILRKY